MLKLEGLGRSPEYVHVVTKCYREAADSVENETYTPEKIADWTKQLESVYNRGLWHGGYYLGKQLGEWSGEYGSHTTTQNDYVGHVTNFFRKINVGEFLIEAGEIKVGEEILITGDTTGVVKCKVEEIILNDKAVDSAKQGDTITFKVPDQIRYNDKLFVIRNRAK